MEKAKQKHGNYVAYMAAFVLILQSLFFVAASASVDLNATNMLDAFGNPLCITSVPSDNDDDTPSHSHFPSCCTFACIGFAPLVPIPENISVIFLSLNLNTRPTIVWKATFFSQHLIREPGRPRAPPS